MARAFTDVLRGIRRGQFVAEATEELAKLVKAVRDTGSSGEMIIRLKLKSASRAAGAVVISDATVVKTPAIRPSETMMFGTDDGSLVDNDPRQNNLELSVAPAAPAAEPKVATPPQTGEPPKVATQS